MATLEKIRNKAGLLVIVVGLALFAFIIGDFLNSGSTYFRQSQETIADVDGEVVKIQDYQSRIDEMVEMYKNQSGQNSLPEEYMSQIRENVFETMVREIVLGGQTDKLGLTVSSEELFDMVQGENISPLIQQMPMFVNQQTGVFDKTALLNFLKTIENDNLSSFTAEEQAQLIKAKNFWLFWEKNIKQQRLEQKYATLLGKAIAVNSIDAKEIFNETAENSDLEYVMQAYASIPDSSITVSDSEVKKLYNERKDLYKQKETKVIKYISVDILPSKEDHDNVSTDIEKLKDEFLTTANVADMVNENSDVPYMDVYFSESAFDPEMKAFALKAEIGEVYGPAFSDNKYRMFKLIDKKTAPDSVKVSHIMLANNQNEASVKSLVDSLKNVIKSGADFAELAKQYSTDQAAENGGELGWFTEISAQRGIGDEFKNVIFSAPVGEVQEVKTMYGTHLVKVTDKTSNVAKYKVADIDMAVSPSSKTYSNIYNELNHFIASNNTVAKMDTAAKTAGYNLLSNVSLTTDNQAVDNIKNSRQVVRWAFKSDKGDISEIFECDDKFVVAVVQGTMKEGYRSVDAVASLLKAEIINEKKAEKIAADLLAKNASDIQQYASAMGSKVDSVKFVNFGTRRITGVGVEPKLNALVSITEVGKISEPVKGNNGVYIFKVYDRVKDAKEYDETAEIKAVESSNAYRFSFQAIQSLMNDAKIKDTRIRYY